ncbi:MAG: threonine synthase, partial [Verrucomicrobiales bacterium]
HEAEFIAETNPNDGSSRFLIPDVSPQSNGDVIVAWAATGSRVYTVHRTNHLPDTNGWTIVHTVSAPRSGASAVYGSDSRSEQPLLRRSSFPRILKNRTFSIRRHTTLGYVKRMRYISTRGKTEPMGFMDAVLTGLAPDGGLLIPESIPDVSSELDAWADLNYPDLAFEVFKRFTDIPEADLRGLVDRAYSTFHHPEIAPVVQVGDVYVLELFHGPTLAFKDMAMQFLSQVYDYVLEQRDETINILGATSGDTGSAAIHGVRGKERIRIFMMHPKGRTSPLQEKQMTSVLDDNVFNLAVDGTFDDCQLIMKSIFADVDFKTEHRLGAVNSVNWCRVLAQIVYYLWAGLKVMKANGAERVRFAVPTGNFGNILAGYYAKQIGLPVDRLVLATNENDILSRFFNTGVYSQGDVHKTISPSMDIQVASNFERYLYYKVQGDGALIESLLETFKQTGSVTVPDYSEDLFIADSGNTEQTSSVIKHYHDAHDYLMDPHTAVGVYVGEQHLSDVPMICVATAHPAKFTAAMIDAIGEEPHHPILDALADAETRQSDCPADENAVRAYIIAHT